MIKGVLFDLDGTLADTIDDLGKAMNRMLSDHGYPVRNREQILAAICYGQREFVIRSMPEEHREDTSLIDKCQAYYAACYNKCYNDATKAYEGVPEVLEALVRKGIVLSIVTNKAQDHAEQVVEKCLGSAHFATVIGGHSGYPAKPSPEGALRAAEIMGVPACECLFVGDSDVDIMTGINAGMKTLGVTWGYRPESTLSEAGADAIAHNSAEMLNVILSL